MGNFYQGWHNKQVTAKMGNGQTCHFRSKFEHTWATYLDLLLQIKAIINWKYESRTFWFENIKRGVCSYKPDFFVESKEGSCYHETKVRLVAKDITKFKRMSLYYPYDPLILVMDRRHPAQLQKLTTAERYVERIIYANEILKKAGMKI